MDKATRDPSRPENEMQSMLLPSFIKTYATTTPFMRQAWHTAYDAIRSSDEIWVIGYSLPDGDSDAQLLLSAANLGEVPEFHIVDINGGDVAARLSKLLTRSSARIAEPVCKKYQDVDWARLLS